MKTIRQGDLLFVPIEADKLPTDLKLRKSGIIAEGEATGHHHRVAELVDAEVFTSQDWRGEERYVRVGPNGVSIVHEEHGPVQLPPNSLYHVKIAREYDYLSELTRRVVD